ncbi:MAG TPA: hypothetical protein VJT31_26245 [Rugosimonospora sp.]|nr:hypothetical protein [Rugosimonospora sp.]
MDPYFLRIETLAVAASATRGECGFTEYARKLAENLCATVGGTAWIAYTRARAMPHRLVDGFSEVLIVTDNRHVIAVTHVAPAGTDRDLFTIRVNGTPIPHRVLTNESPHGVGETRRSVWLHLNGIPVENCDTLLCPRPATVATWRQCSMCRPCARAYVAGVR